MAPAASSFASSRGTVRGLAADAAAGHATVDASTINAQQKRRRRAIVSMLGSGRRPASCCNTACGRPIRNELEFLVRAPRLLLAVLLAVTALFVAACGGDDDSSSSTDVNDLLAQTFSGTKEMKSG